LNSPFSAQSLHRSAHSRGLPQSGTGLAAWEPITHSTAKSVICEEIEAVLKCLNSRSPIKMNIWAFYLAIEKTNYTDEI